MPDKAPYNESFFDRAWEDMRDQLEQELPEKRQRPFLWWAWASGGLVLLILFTWLSHEHRSTPEIRAFPLPQTGRSVYQHGQASIDLKGRPVAEIKTPIFSYKEKQLIVQSKPVEEGNLPAPESFLKKDKSGIDSFETSSHGISLSPIPGRVLIVTASDATVDTGFETLLQFSDTKTKDSPSKHWVALAGLGHNLQANRTGRAGFERQLPLGDRFKFETGLHFRLAAPYLKPSSTSSLPQETEDQLGPDVSTPITPSADLPTQGKLNIRTHNLELPLRFTYLLSPAFEVGLGLQVDYLLHATTKENSVPNLSGKNQNEFAQTTYDLQVDDLQRWVAGAQIGWRYHLNTHWDLEAQYFWQLPMELPNNDAYRQVEQGLELVLRFNW